MLLNCIKLYTAAAVIMCCSCSRTYVSPNKNVPVITGHSTNSTAKPASATPARRSMTKRITPATTAPKAIWVNDKAAKKKFDGRLYYDLEGKRYWKNYVDGKYYLYNKAMYSNAAFKPR